MNTETLLPGFDTNIEIKFHIVLHDHIIIAHPSLRLGLSKYTPL